MQSALIVAHPTNDLLSSIVALRCAGQTFLFGRVGEGTQRAFANNKSFKLGSVQQIFLTGRTKWNGQMGGIIGVSGAISEAMAGRTKKAPALEVYGDDRLKWAVATLRHACFRRGSTAKFKHASSDIVNQYMTVSPVYVLPRGNSTALPADYKFHKEIDNILEHLLEPSSQGESQLPPAFSKMRLPVPDSADASLCYIIQPNQDRDALSAKCAIELGVPEGRALSGLLRGVPYTLDSGITVTPDMIIEKAKPPRRIVILDLPSPDYVAPATRIDWMGSRPENGTVLHILGASVDPFSNEYGSFIESFGPTCQHFISHPDYCANTFSYSRSASLKNALRSISPFYFTDPDLSEAKLKVPKKFRRSCAPFVTGLAIISQDAPDVFGATAQSTVGKRKLSGGSHNSTSQSGKPSTYNKGIPVSSAFDKVQCICVGSGSGSPSVYKNVTGTIVRFPFYQNILKSILLDCGEATVHNLRRMYKDKEQYELAVLEVSLVLISHMHPDHHLGLLCFIEEWMRLDRSGRVLYVIGPWRLNIWLEDWKQTMPELARVRFIDAISCLVSSDTKISTLDHLKTALSLKSVTSVYAVHCDDAFSYSVEFANGFKLSYSGDTRPNLDFVQIGKDSNLLVHEATLDDGRLKDAIKKNHCTVSESLGVARAMNSSNVLLTHISPRYPVLPPFSGKRMEGFVNSCKYGLLNEDEHGLFLNGYKGKDSWSKTVKITVAVDGLVVNIEHMGLQSDWAEKLGSFDL